MDLHKNAHRFIVDELSLGSTPFKEVGGCSWRRSDQRPFGHEDQHRPPAGQRPDRESALFGVFLQCC